MFFFIRLEISRSRKAANKHITAAVDDQVSLGNIDIDSNLLGLAQGHKYWALNKDGYHYTSNGLQDWLVIHYSTVKCHIDDY